MPAPKNATVEREVENRCMDCDWPRRRLRATTTSAARDHRAATGHSVTVVVTKGYMLHGDERSATEQRRQERKAQRAED